MKTVRQFFSCHMIRLAACLIFAGCARQDAGMGDEVTVKVACWGTPQELQIITSAVRGWEQDNPGVAVKIEHTNYSDYVSKVLTRIAGGTPPDIIFTEVDNFVSFYQKGALLNLSPQLEQDEDFQIEDYFPEVVRRFTRDGGIYCIPRDTAPFACVFYNKDLFDEAGVEYPRDDWTWVDLLLKAKALTRIRDGVVQQYGFYAWAWQNFVYSNGGSLVDDVSNPTRCTMDSAQSVGGLQFYADLVLKHRVSPSQTALQNLGMQITQMFMGGRLAMFASGIWETPVLRSNPEISWDVAMFPGGPGGKRGYGTGGSGYAILKTTKHPEQAWQVVKALSGTYGQTRFAKAGLAQPANRLIAEGPDWAQSPLPPQNKGMLNEAVRYVTYNPFHPQWRMITDLYINPNLDLVFGGQKTAYEVMTEITPKINAALRGRE